ncbi:hypothetical protein LINGRAPRIM_LOCUS2156 [Linum grandiflorum]
MPEAKGSRCSVKPASRIALHSRNHEPLIYTKSPWPNFRLGSGRPIIRQPRPSNQSKSIVPQL